MTHPSPRFRILAQLTACASCLCLAFACGGTTENDPHDEDGPTTDSGPTNGGPTNGGPTNGGPTNGGPTNDSVTTVGITTGGPTTGGGGTSGSDCPSLEPAAGSGCSVDAQVCEYANCTAPDYRDAHLLSCVQGAWQLTGEEACEDVPITCPPSIYRGQYCDVPEGTGPCTVVDACGELRNTYCTNGVWEYGNGGSEDAAPFPTGGGGAGTGPGSVATQTTNPRPTPQCPDYAPVSGAACCPYDYPTYCDYSEGGSDEAIGSPSAATGIGSYTVVSGTGFGSTGGAPPPPLTCASCSADMTWTASSDCP